MPLIAHVEPLTSARSLSGPFDYCLPPPLADGEVDVGSMLVVPFGRLADIIGRRRLYLIGLGLLTVASLVAGAAPNVAVLILARIAWVSGAAALSRWRCRPRADGTPGPTDAIALSPRAAAVVAWCGMRGTVTLAAALALPTAAGGGTPFPQRDIILFTSFAVVVGTLVLQGVTLRPLITRLRLRDDGYSAGPRSTARGVGADVYIVVG